MATSVAIAGLTLVGVLLVMVAEAVHSARHERVMRARGAIEPSGDVYATMRWAYPASFVAMALEGAWTGPSPTSLLASGLAVFGLSKALKIWAISALGVRWTFRVLVLPNAPLIRRGPYALVRHPNYVAVVGEILGVALIVWAPVSGLIAAIGFGTLLRRRITVEDRALRQK